MRIGIVLSVDTQVLTGNMKAVLDGNVKYPELHLALEAVRQRSNYPPAENRAGIVSGNNQNDRKC